MILGDLTPEQAIAVCIGIGFLAGVLVVFIVIAFAKFETKCDQYEELKGRIEYLKERLAIANSIINEKNFNKEKEENKNEKQNDKQN